MNVLQEVIGWAWVIFGTFVFVGQLISSVNFPLAQRLGLQEKSENADALASKLELMTARWDALLLWIAPLAGVLMLTDHSLWPSVSLIAGAVYVDAGGREWAKSAGLSAQGVSIGTAKERAIIYGTYVALILIGLGGIAAGLTALL